MLPDLYPALIDEYDEKKRLCRIKIPGITDGCDVYPIAEFNYPIGDKSEHTEIRIKKNDRVWVAFQHGDARHPVIMGFRPRQKKNELKWRRFQHENIDLRADSINVEPPHENPYNRIILRCGDNKTCIVIEPGLIRLQAKKIFMYTPEFERYGNMPLDPNELAENVEEIDKIKTIRKMKVK